MNFNNIYATKRVMEEVPVHVQLFLLHILTERQGEGQELDYLQIFELKEDENGNQLVINFQEVPPYQVEKTLKKHPNFPSINQKIYIIDDEQHLTITHPEDR